MKDTVRTSFTKGPWHAEDWSGDDIYAAERGGGVYASMVVDKPQPSYVLVAVCRTLEPYTSPDETKANARLIAAAPDMYKSLRDLVGEINLETLIPKGLTSGTAVSAYGAFAEKVIRAQATLRKADGRD